MTHPDLERGAEHRSARRRRQLGVGFAVVPLVAFTMFAVGEAVGGESGWWSHLLQVAGVALLAAFAWVRPRVGGVLLLVVGTLLSAILLLTGDDLATGLVVVAIFFAPLILAGVFFALAGYGAGRDGEPGHPRTGPTTEVTR